MGRLPHPFYHCISFIVLGLFSFNTAQAQSLLDQIQNESDISPHPVSATYKDTRIINLQSNETPGKGVLHFVIAHRFGKINEGLYSLWGLDNASMRMAFDYGITDRIACGIARSTFQKTVEANVKIRAIQQLSDGSMPLSITWYSVIMANGLRWSNPELNNYFTSRLSYTHQAILSRKFNDRLSLSVAPSFTHRNLVNTTGDSHDQWTIGTAGRFKMTNRTSLNAEYHFLVKGLDDQSTNSLSLGVDIDTGGHVFQLHVTNSQGMFERAFLTETVGKWSEGALYFGFNLSRVFS
ncbi:MAG: DUF5777 family beta-barrel protein [Flavobacteriales bacterium]|jgi:hypothetical protein